VDVWSYRIDDVYTFLSSSPILRYMVGRTDRQTCIYEIDIKLHDL
jgi:hypothetical protein